MFATDPLSRSTPAHGGPDHPGGWRRLSEAAAAVLAGLRPPGRADLAEDPPLSDAPSEPPTAVAPAAMARAGSADLRAAEAPR